jgi:hypothetical protein
MGDLALLEGRDECGDGTGEQTFFHESVIFVLQET